MFTPGHFLTSTLGNHPQRDSVTRIIASAFESAHAGEAVKRFLQKNPLPRTQRTYAFGLGKAACTMTSALADFVPLTDSLVITKHASRVDVRPATVIENRIRKLRRN